MIAAYPGAEYLAGSDSLSDPQSVRVRQDGQIITFIAGTGASKDDPVGRVVVGLDGAPQSPCPGS